MKQLTEEQQIEIREVMGHTGFKLMLAELNAAAALMSDAVLNYDLSTGSDRELALRKARAEGARSLLLSFTRRLESLSPQKRR